MTARNNSNRPLILVLFMVFGLATNAFADGPWTQPRGSGYLQLSYSYLPEYSSLFGKSDNTIQLDRDVTDRTFVAYFEYGISDGLTAIIDIPVKDLGIAPRPGPEPIITKRSRTAVGNISLALKWNFIRKRILVSGQMKLNVKASNEPEDISNGLRSGSDAWGILPSVHVGGSYKNMYGYFDTGINLRSNDYSHELLMTGEAGIKLLQRIWFTGVVHIREALNTGTHDTAQTPTGLYPDNQEYFAYGAKLILEITEKLGVNFSSFSGISGHLVARSPSRTFGIYYRW